MIQSLKIRNFKSIKELELECKKINLFIGEPNVGKSNILEIIGILSHLYYSDLRSFVRLGDMRDLFYDHILEERVSIGFDGNLLDIGFKDGNFELNVRFGNKEGSISYNHDGSLRSYLTPFSECKQFKFYRFRVREDFPNSRSEFLIPPDGPNLLAVIISRKELRTIVKEIFERFGLRIVFELPSKIRIEKQLEDIAVSFPYHIASETLQRLVFYLTAIYSNKESILAFEEPEAHAFPYYTKYLAERIALDKSGNQYFISTHNPYFLLSILEKAPKEDVRVFGVYFRDFQTKVKPLTEKDVEKVLEEGIDIFLNLEGLLGLE